MTKEKAFERDDGRCSWYVNTPSQLVVALRMRGYQTPNNNMLSFCLAFKDDACCRGQDNSCPLMTQEKVYATIPTEKEMLIVNLVI